MHEKIDKVALMANNGITALAGTVNCLQNYVNGITKVVIPIVYLDLISIKQMVKYL